MTKEEKIISGMVALGLLAFWQRKKLKPLILAMIPGPKPQQINTGMISKVNLVYLEGLHPKYKDLFKTFISNIQALGFDPQINSGYRNFEKQARLKKEDPRNATPGLSPHNYGVAIDVQVSKNGKVYGKATPQAEWLTTGIPQMAEKLGLFWGAKFKGYSDAVHFEVRGINTRILQELAYKQFKTTDPRLIQGNQVTIV